jgi:hypothetical protein
MLSRRTQSCVSGLRKVVSVESAKMCQCWQRPSLRLITSSLGGSYNDQPVRLTLACDREGEEAWTVPQEVRVDQGAPPSAQVLDPAD